MRLRLIPLLLAGAVLVPAAPAGATQVLRAPGRLALAIGPARVGNIDQGGVSAAVETGADGSLVALVPISYGQGATLVALGGDGLLRPGFGDRGIVRVRVPAGVGRFDVRQLLRDAQGRLLLLGSTADVGLREPRAAVMRLTATGVVDGSYGTGGLVRLDAVAAGGGGDVGADGSVVLAASGATAQRWDVLRLDPSGRPDPGFGVAGTVSLDTSGARATAARLLPDGRIVTTAATNAVVTGGYAARLLPDGRLDPSYGGGTPVPIPFPQDLLVRSDGRLDVLQAIVAPQRVARFTPDGRPDESFGLNGAAAVDPSLQFARLMARGDGGDLVWAGNPQPGFPGRRDLALQEVTADGWTQPLRETSIPFAAGPTSLGTFQTAESPHGLLAGALVGRADGRLLVLGGTPVQRYTGEGEGYSTVPLAAALLRADDTLEPSFGGPSARAAATVTLDRQRARTAVSRRRRGIRVHVRTSGPGTVLLRVRDGRGRVLAEEVTAALSRAPAAATVRVTAEGRRRLAGRRRVRVVVGVKFRDVVGVLAGATRRGTLR